MFSSVRGASATQIQVQHPPQHDKPQHLLVYAFTHLQVGEKLLKTVHMDKTNF